MFGMSLLGVKRGYNGLLGLSKKVEDDFVELNLDTVLDIADLPGTYLRTARCREFLDPAVRERAVKILKEMDVAGLVVIGGDGSFLGAQYLCELGMPCIGIPAFRLRHVDVQAHGRTARRGQVFDAEQFQPKRFHRGRKQCGDFVGLVGHVVSRSRNRNEKPNPGNDKGPVGPFSDDAGLRKFGATFASPSPAMDLQITIA